MYSVRLTVTRTWAPRTSLSSIVPTFVRTLLRKELFLTSVEYDSWEVSSVMSHCTNQNSRKTSRSRPWTSTKRTSLESSRRSRTIRSRFKGLQARPSLKWEVRMPRTRARHSSTQRSKSNLTTKRACRCSTKTRLTSIQISKTVSRETRPGTRLLIVPTTDSCLWEILKRDQSILSREKRTY